MNAEHAGEKKGGWLTRWRQPKPEEQRLATLQEGFNELVGLTRSIREHMQQQARTQATLVEMMEHLPGAVEGLKSVGEATKQQTETLGILKRQLEAAARNEDHMMESMQSFNKTLALMDDLSKSTSQTVSSMADRTRDSEDLLRTILERSERRLIIMIVTVMIVTLTVLGVGLYVGFGQRTDAPAPLTPAEESQPVIVDEPTLTAEESAVLLEFQKSISELGDWPEEDVEPPFAAEEPAEVPEEAELDPVDLDTPAPVVTEEEELAPLHDEIDPADLVAAEESVAEALDVEESDKAASDEADETDADDADEERE